MGEKQCIAYMDEDNNVVRYEPIDAPKTLGNKWVAIFQSGMGYLKRQGLTGEQWNVYAHLVEHLDYDNWCRVRQKDIAEDLNITQSHVSRALKKLVEVDVLVKGPLAGHCNTYRLNPRIGHRGTRHYQNTIIQYAELKRKQAKR